MKIKVETYSGYKADERPTAIFLEDKTIQVKEIKERCIRERHDGEREEVFVVLTSDGKRQTIAHNLIKEEWFLESI
ncbi:MAG: hypothetical protein AB1414_12470 [bacterium]